MSKHFLQLRRTAEASLVPRWELTSAALFSQQNNHASSAQDAYGASRMRRRGIKCQQTTVEGQEGRFHIIGREDRTEMPLAIVLTKGQIRSSHRILREFLR